MEILNALTKGTDTITTKLLDSSESISISIYGTIEISKGNFKQEIYYNFYNVELNKYGYIEYDDKEYYINATYINDCKVDDINKFRNALREGGLTTLANNLEFDRNLIEESIYKEVSQSNIYIKHFNNKTFWSTLNDKEKFSVRLKYVISNSEVHLWGSFKDEIEKYSEDEDLKELISLYNNSK